MIVVKAKEEWKNFGVGGMIFIWTTQSYYLKVTLNYYFQLYYCSQEKTTTRTHEGNRLLGVHIGVYQPYYCL